jgi:sugar lactone lactonase YvrE
MTRQERRMTIPVLEARTLLNGLVMGESPRWWNGRLWVCDWGARELVTIDMAGRREAIVPVDALPFCIDPLPDGRLLVSAAGQVLYMAQHRQLKPYADLSGLSDKPWNEIVVVARGEGRGNAYVNNIGFDFPHGEVTTGIIAVVRPDGVARQVADGVAFPNGMVVTPDGATLIVAESYGQCLTAFDILTATAACRTDASGRRSTAIRTGSASMPRGRSGTPTCRAAAACGWRKAGRSWPGSRPIAAASPAPWAGRTERPCSSSPPTGADRRAWATRRGPAWC